VPELFTDAAGADTGLSGGACEGGAVENSWAQGEPVPLGLEGEGFGEGEVAPDIILMDQFGQQTCSWQFYGQVIALDISTIWCGPCRDLAGGVTETWEDYNAQGFAYLTLLSQDMNGQVPDQAELEEWATTYGIEQPVLADGAGHSNAISPDGTFPQIVVIGRDMRVVVEKVSPSTEESAIRAAIESAL
jgi:thiol-disulfide isomerase/thioredoxin